MSSMMKQEVQTMDTTESASTGGQLSFQQLRVASRKISLSRIDKVARQLRVPEEALEEVQFELQQQVIDATGYEKKLQILEAWKRSQPDKCNLDNLVKTLRDLQFNKTADDIIEEVNTSKREKELLEQDEKCHSNVLVVEDVVNDISQIVRGCYYKGLGFELGLSREQMDTVGIACKKENSLSSYVHKMLMSWVEHDGANAVVGKLYKALRILECNDMANKVFDICVPSTSENVNDLK